MSTSQKSAITAITYRPLLSSFSLSHIPPSSFMIWSNMFYAMAFVNSNPALLTLATISGRKKRSVSFNNLDLIGTDLDRDAEGSEYVREVGILSRFLSSNPGLDIGDQRDQLMAGVLQCSNIGSSQCLDALVCEYSRRNSRSES